MEEEDFRRDVSLKISDNNLCYDLGRDVLKSFNLILTKEKKEEYDTIDIINIDICLQEQNITETLQINNEISNCDKTKLNQMFYENYCLNDQKLRPN